MTPNSKLFPYTTLFRSNLKFANRPTSRKTGEKWGTPGFGTALSGEAVGKNTTASAPIAPPERDRKSTRLNSSHQITSYAVFCLKKRKEGFELQTGTVYR